MDRVIDETVTHISDFTRRPGDFTRNRKLNAATTIKVTLNMEGQSLNTEMIHAFPDMDERMTASAYEQQKAKLSPELFMHLFREFNKTAHNHKLLNEKYEVYAIDGSDFNIPYQSKSKYAMPNPNYTVKKKGGEEAKPLSMLHGNLLFNLMDRTYEDIVIQSRLKSDERSAAIDMLERLHPEHPYIVIMDRGYEGFNMFMHGNNLNGEGYYIIRTRTGIIKEIANIPDKECDVDLSIKTTTSSQYYLLNKDKENVHKLNASPKGQYKSSTKYNYSRWDFGEFETVNFRVVKFKINNSDTGREEWEVLATNLNRFEFPISRMKEMYHLRWDIETSFRELKYALGGVQFHSRKDDFVEMELLAHLIMFNAVSRTISAVRVPQSKLKKYKYVVSFKDAVTLVRKYYRLFMKDPPDGIFQEILGYTRPIIPGRKDKRNMKVKSAVWFVYRVA